jgi:regulatory protein
MAGTVTAMRFQKRNTNRVNVYIDGQFAFGLAAIEAARLQVGQTLSDDDIARLQRQDEVERAYERALNFLSYRPRSEHEIRSNLRKKKVADDIVEWAVERLTRAGLIHDREFAHYWVENRLQFNPRGKHALRHELRAKGISTSIIAETLADLDETVPARRAAEAGARRLAHLEPHEFRRKLKAYLTRRGFSYEAIEPLIESMREAVQGEDLSDTE